MAFPSARSRCSEGSAASAGSGARGHLTQRLQRRPDPADKLQAGYAQAVSLFATALRVHQKIYERTDGLVGHRLLRVPTLLLRTTGARSGATRTNALVYARDGDRYLVVSSNGGADRAPAWLHNLRKSPAAEVQIGRKRFTGCRRSSSASRTSLTRYAALEAAQ